jgi:hypothetical protein
MMGIDDSCCKDGVCQRALPPNGLAAALPCRRIRRWFSLKPYGNSTGITETMVQQVREVLKRGRYRGDYESV